METYYKVLGKNRTCYNGGKGQWLPPGEWMPEIVGELLPCRNGYHILKRDQLILWLGPEIWEVEIKGEILEEVDKCVSREVRLTRQLANWNEKTALLFGADCAERVLHIFENRYPSDNRPRLAIQATRDFANGKIGAAARAAAWDAARAAARAAAWDAARDAAWDAARDAAGDAAWDAARAAAWDAAWDAERKWQTERLFILLEISTASKP